MKYHFKKKKGRKVYNLVKRIFDIVMALFALLILLPVFIIIAILIKSDDGGPIFYKHKRVGKNGKSIYVYKFRSMAVNADEIFSHFTEEQIKEFEKYYKLENDPRITRIGDFLRKNSLDELPQFLNILKGDMSFVGPRPVVSKELNKFGDSQDLLLSIRPGLTGWWACSGRSDTSYEQRVDLEIYYVNNYCAKLDFLCLVKTIGAVVEGKGAK